MRIAQASDHEAIDEAARIIRKGGLVAFPTETVYGLGADARNPQAVAKIFEVKRRPSFDPLIVHLAQAGDAGRYGLLPDGAARELIKKFWPGPLTLVVPKTDAIPPIVTAGLDTVALRVPGHPAALSLIRAAQTAIAAPSANLFGAVSPTEARHVAEQMGDAIDLILDGGRCAVGVESTIVSFAAIRPCILRAGGVPIEDIEMMTGPMERFTGASDRPAAPGQLKRHYATGTPLVLLETEDAPVPDGSRIGLLAFTAPRQPEKYAAVEVLSSSGDLREAAANLFSALRRLDALGLDMIAACRFPERDLGIAIMDRLRRGSAP